LIPFAERIVNRLDDLRFDVDAEPRMADGDPIAQRHLFERGEVCVLRRLP